MLLLSGQSVVFFSRARRRVFTSSGEVSVSVVTWALMVCTLLCVIRVLSCLASVTMNGLNTARTNVGFSRLLCTFLITFTVRMLVMLRWARMA